MSVTGPTGHSYEAAHDQKRSASTRKAIHSVFSHLVDLDKSNYNLNPQAPVAQKIADEMVFRRFQGEEFEFF